MAMTLIPIRRLRENVKHGAFEMKVACKREGAFQMAGSRLVMPDSLRCLPVSMTEGRQPISVTHPF